MIQQGVHWQDACEFIPLLVTSCARRSLWRERRPIRKSITKYYWPRICKSNEPLIYRLLNSDENRFQGTIRKFVVENEGEGLNKQYYFFCKNQRVGFAVLRNLKLSGQY